MSAKRVLFVAYLFPPCGGVGVQRVTKWVKYLPAYGWDCSVLTVANPSAPLSDDSFVRDIPEATVIRRARTLEPGYTVKNLVSASGGTGGKRANVKLWIKKQLRGVVNTVLQPDTQVLWHPAAKVAGMQLLREMPHDVIVATGPPFSSLLLGAELSRRSGTPLVLDYRDEWGISNAYWENKAPNRMVQWVQKRQQERCLRKAELVLGTTPSTTDNLRSLIEQAGSSARAECIYNGFDPDDFPPETSNDRRIDYGHGSDKFRLACVGTLWNLNPIGPIVDAVLKLQAESPALLDHLELVFAGRRTAPQEADLDRLNGTACHVVRLPYVSHDEAIRLMRTSDGNLLLNADLPDTQRIVNAKTFEYMAARKPIFVVAPPGDLWDVVRDLPGTILCPPREIDGIARALRRRIEEHIADARLDHEAWDVERFERRRLAGQLADLLADVTGSSTDADTFEAPSLDGDEPNDIPMRLADVALTR
jgi:glycosyltransferase involved in cell wall biosynthesis